MCIRDRSTGGAGTATAVIAARSSITANGTADSLSTNGTANQVWGMNSAGTAQGWQSGTSVLTGIRYANNGAADTAATSAQVQTTIGASVYDAYGAATTVQNYYAVLQVRRLSMSGAVSLGSTDSRYQFLDPNGASRTVTLSEATPPAGRVFAVKNINTGSYTITIVNASSQTVAILAAGQTASVVWDGTVWEVM